MNDLIKTDQEIKDLVNISSDEFYDDDEQELSEIDESEFINCKICEVRLALEDSFFCESCDSNYCDHCGVHHHSELFMGEYDEFEPDEDPNSDLD